MVATVYDFLLFVHVLFAFALVAAVTTFWALILSTQPGRMLLTPRGAMLLGRVGGMTVAVSGFGVLVFGVWLAIYIDGYELWDGWILASLVLWLVSTIVGIRSGRLYERAAEPDADAVVLRRQGLMLQVISSAAILFVLILMIFKPGA
ncbi:MAG: hypothetical protein ABR583_03745 [Gaiellaceae bacterium]